MLSPRPAWSGPLPSSLTTSSLPILVLHRARATQHLLWLYAPSIFAPQGLCTCSSSCLECSFPSPYTLAPTSLQVIAQHHILWKISLSSWSKEETSCFLVTSFHFSIVLMKGYEVILIAYIHLMVFLFMIQELCLPFTVGPPDPRVKVGRVLFVLWTNENMHKKGKAIHQIASTFYKVTGIKGNISLLPLFFMFSVIYFVIKEEEKEMIYLPKCPHKHKKRSPIVCPTVW